MRFDLTDDETTELMLLIRLAIHVCQNHRDDLVPCPVMSLMMEDIDKVPENELTKKLTDIARQIVLIRHTAGSA